jgi:hypothetical protein
MQLSSQDSLRLNVLLAQPLKAVRIDESHMVVHALCEQGEAKVELNPVGRHDAYLKSVRQLFSSHVLGSPGGYPVFLRRWTRMGQARDQSLAKLLLLGEPEAVAAVVHASGLTEDIAERAWWAYPSSENARRMLDRDTVAGSPIGRELAQYLLEYLPFEQEHVAAIDSIRSMLKPDLLDAAQRNQLWTRAKRRPSYYVGFLQAIPDGLPDHAAPHAEYERLRASAQNLAADNRYMEQLLRCLSGTGQSFLHTARKVVEKPANQDVVVALLDAIGNYFNALGPGTRHHRDINAITQATEMRLADAEDEALRQALASIPDARPYLRAMIRLSMVGEPLVAPVFGMTDAIGTVMRRRLDPILSPMLEWIGVLAGGGESV